MVTARVYDTPDGMDEEYREVLVGLIKRQIWAEMAATVMYSHAVSVAPNWRDRCAAAHLAVEEANHVTLIGDILANDFGVDVEAHMRQRPNSIDGNFPALLGVRESPLGDDEKFPPTWTAAAVALFLADRAAVYQLAQYKDNSYRPWAEAMEVVLEDEAGEGGHMDIGEATVRKMCADPQVKAEIQAWVDAFMPASTKLLGKPGNPLDEFCLDVGLKRKTSEQCQLDFFGDLVPIVESVGLVIPDLQSQGVTLVPGVIDQLEQSSAYPHALSRPH